MNLPGNHPRCSGCNAAGFLEKPNDHLTILAIARALLIIAKAHKMKNVMPRSR
jgi:hypothetical protein